MVVATEVREGYRDKALACLDRLPPFSPILSKLLASLARDDVSLVELAELVEKDTVLAGNVLRLVNSALYGLRGTVTSVRRAVAMTGINKLRNMVLALSVSRIWTHNISPRGWSGARFDLHSVATGLLADLLVQHRFVECAEGAFVAGLMHDLGKLLIATGLPLECETVRSLMELGGRTTEECELEVIGVSHASLSAATLERWNLPAAVREAVEFHHAPERAGGAGRGLSHIVHSADALANEMGITVLHPIGDARPAPEASLESLGLSEAKPVILEEFHREFEAIRLFF